MAFRQTTFDPSVSQQYARQGPGVTGLPQARSTVDMAAMEEALARQLAQQKITDERRKREIEKLCSESDELKELQAKIKAAYLNKERSQQMTEKQYRIQTEIVSSPLPISLLPASDPACDDRSKTRPSTSRC